MKLDKRTIRNAALVAGGTAVVGGVAVGAGLALAGAALWKRMRSADLNGQVVLITGGSRGLGLAMAHEFGALGCKLAICARDAGELAWAKSELELAGYPCLTVVCDVGDEAQVERMARDVVEHYGQVDVLVNNAGVIMVGPLKNQTRADFKEAMDVMFWGTIHTTLAVLPHMFRRGYGRIVNITSMGGRMAVPHMLPYNCAKFAAVGFSEGLHAEVKKDGVIVTTVSPGLMRTGSYKNAIFKGKNELEYNWFALGATLPLISIDAQRAARKIVSACRRGAADLMITPQAWMTSAFHGAFPGVTAEMMALVNRLLPNEVDGRRERFRGHESETALTRSFLTKMGRDAAERLHETA
ncbi:MAG TPA: SDR family oxidoreductase [Terriglobales bacterium]|nr:SDR family oxidoreductase [Terriglobales bacterium]